MSIISKDDEHRIMIEMQDLIEKLQRERDQLREALEDTQHLLGRYLYLAGDISINLASSQHETNRALLAQEDKDIE